jgi:hypothetical protein
VIRNAPSTASAGTAESQTETLGLRPDHRSDAVRPEAADLLAEILYLYSNFRIPELPNLPDAERGAMW